MKRMLILIGALAGLAAVDAAELVFDFNELEVGDAPPGWKQSVTGGGGPSRWEIVMDEIPSELARLVPDAPITNVRPVVAQTSDDQTDERFPLLYFEGEEFSDFTLTTRIKMVAGETEQMAGIAFRMVDERNYHVVRASAKGDTVMFYSFIDGQRTAPIGNQVDIPSNEWLQLEVAARGTEFRIKLNGREVIPPLNNPNFRKGRIGYWTKSDSISYFADTRMDYTPVIPPAQRLVASAKERYERLLGLRILIPKDEQSMEVLASTDPSEVGQPGYEEERRVMNSEQFMYLKNRDDVTVSLPLRDRNGDPVAVVRVTMETFRGQTQMNAIARAQPVVSHIQNGILDYADLIE